MITTTSDRAPQPEWAYQPPVITPTPPYSALILRLFLLLFTGTVQYNSFQYMTNSVLRCMIMYTAR